MLAYRQVPINDGGRLLSDSRFIDPDFDSWLSICTQKASKVPLIYPWYVWSFSSAIISAHLTAFQAGSASSVGRQAPHQPHFSLELSYKVFSFSTIRTTSSSATKVLSSSSPSRPSLCSSTPSLPSSFHSSRLLCSRINLNVFSCTGYEFSLM